MFQQFARVAQEQNHINQINQVTSIIETFIRNVRLVSNKELNIPTSLAMKDWFLNKTKEEKFQIVDNFLKTYYKNLYQ
jgi:c-di-AMP phosphodiesterase-like protein